MEGRSYHAWVFDGCDERKLLNGRENWVARTRSEDETMKNGDVNAEA